jgi:hypothetical protein
VIDEHEFSTLRIVKHIEQPGKNRSLSHALSRWPIIVSITLHVWEFRAPFSTIYSDTQVYLCTMEWGILASV